MEGGEKREKGGRLIIISAAPKREGKAKPIGGHTLFLIGKGEKGGKEKGGWGLSNQISFSCLGGGKCFGSM